ESEVMYSDKGEVPEGEYLIPIGKAEVKKTGKDVTIVSFGKMIPRVVNPAIEELAKMGIDAELVDLRTVRPIDYDTIIASVKKTNRCVIVEEAWPLSSIATELAYMIQRKAFDYMDAPVIRVNSMDVSLPYAPTLIEAILPNVKRTIDAVKAVMYRS
ncbi:MAG: alpha-ketoacid dehydrogenase subunit beta, partial [Spirosomaceae bacterium]|nr:alpha-ketoacid dehydrogenase subunit beta [Spirosomataceae bacterium]